MPLRVERADGSVTEVAGLGPEGHVLYFVTHNANAAISTGANRLQAAPYALSGAGLTIGMWDGGSGRVTHREFASGRMVNMDGAASIDHATHVGGTLVAAGVTAAAKGMAYAAQVDSYDWNNDLSEMTSRGASAPGQAGRIYLSNHSYGYLTGWYRTGGSTPAFIWYGSGTTPASIDPEFGQYNTYARDADALAYTAPYYLVFRSAGNDRTDNPAAGQVIQLSPSNTATTTYDPAAHPAGDGTYRGGYDTIGYESVAKNVITIGSVADAVTSGARDPAKAAISSFSAWGPTDDGRIKPDIVANGESLYSSLNSGDSSYGYMSGTSMSSPNATGTAALLIAQYGQLFPGGAMRASSLKGLLIHTATDLGRTGPDYVYGWGLLDGERAALLLDDHHAHPEKSRLHEGLLTTTAPGHTFEFIWDGVTPIRATLCWTDPAGTATTSADSRTVRLRNNLDLRIIGPDNETYRPFVMPFVGAWTVESMSATATTGVNNTDNVEQVRVASPAAGVYRVEVSYQGVLTDSQQYFSLLIDGASGEVPPPPPLSITAVSPDSAYSGATVPMVITGRALDTATDVRLTRDGFPDIIATGLQMSGEDLTCLLDLTGAATGLWDLTVASETESAVLAGAFAVAGALWSENFDGTVSGWSSTVLNSQGSNQWTLSTSSPHTSPLAYFAPGPSTKSTTALVSPSIPVPAGAANIQLRFWHSYNLQSRQDGGRLEYSVDEGAWTGVGESGSGTEFAANGYTATISSTGAPSSRSFFAGLPAWTGNSGGFLETIVNLTDTTRFAGKSLRLRWILATNSSTASAGWTVDSIVLLGSGNFTNPAPVISAPIDVPGAEILILNPGTPEEQKIFLVDSVSANLTVAATDNGGPETLSYTWSAQGPASVFFLPNGTPASASTVADFEAVGDYTLVATVADAEGLTATDQATVRVRSTPSALRVDPGTASVEVGGSIPFAAVMLDQFNEPVPDQPASFDWSATGGGTVDGTGLFSATTAGENFSVIATAVLTEGSLSDFALVTVLPAPATVQLADLDVPYTGEPQGATVTTNPEGLAVTVRYDGSETLPVGPGSYAVEAVITDPNYQGSASGTFTIRSNDLALYDAWAAEREWPAGGSGPDDDPDADGMCNWTEWLFGFDPNDPASRLKATLEYQPGALDLRINRVITRGTFEIYQSLDLAAWTWMEAIDVGSDANDVIHPLPSPDSTPAQFYRLYYTAP